MLSVVQGNAGSHICLSSKQLLLFLKMSVRSGLQTPVSEVLPRVPLVGPQRCACPLPPRAPERCARSPTRPWVPLGSRSHCASEHCQLALLSSN